MSQSKKRKGKSRDWYNRHTNDPYVKKAIGAGYRARAVYKLQEIDEKYRLIKPNQNIIDLGATPGSWSQYAAKKMNDNALIVAVDLLDMKPLEHVQFIQGDFTEQATLDKIDELSDEQHFDLVISDMAPNITGIALQDQARYERLLESVLEFCEHRLRPGGHLLTKFFEGQSADEIRKQMKLMFQSLKAIKPDASRSESKELYLLAQNKRASKVCT